jgi:cyclopropane fatty-acyl-phospholipid synthase-like methyltransferase
MTNKKVQEYYDKMAKKITSPKETRNKAPDFSEYDRGLMKKLSGKEKKLLDLGSGTGLLINHLYEDFEKIVAVEKYEAFSKFIDERDNIEVRNEDLLEVKPEESFYDIVSLFGVMNYFNSSEAEKIYKKVYHALKPKGMIVVKNQFGVKEDVIIEGYSKELQTDYFSHYRQTDKEIACLKKIGFCKIEKIDIYPPKYNRWNNTHFFALIGYK